MFPLPFYTGMIFVFLSSLLDRILNILGVTVQTFCNFNIKLYNDIAKILVSSFSSLSVRGYDDIIFN